MLLELLRPAPVEPLRSAWKHGVSLRIRQEIVKPTSNGDVDVRIVFQIVDVGQLDHDAVESMITEEVLADRKDDAVGPSVILGAAEDAKELIVDTLRSVRTGEVVRPN